MTAVHIDGINHRRQPLRDRPLSRRRDPAAGDGGRQRPGCRILFDQSGWPACALPPLDEVEVVIDGEVEYYLHGEWIHGEQGTVPMLPAGVAHSVHVPAISAQLCMSPSARRMMALPRAVGAVPRRLTTSLESIVAAASRAWGAPGGRRGEE